jgi:hypothetical protein|tara:strand:+ start:1892 stop:2440 length:549 start_codon:yes stop_codon:yes gene_type:complete
MKKFKIKILKESYYQSLKDAPLYDEANNHIGERVWVHTERTMRNRGQNGMIGVYKASNTGAKTGNPYFKTNAITLEDCIFKSSEKSASKIVKTGHRTLVAGCSGTIIDLEETNWNPFDLNSSTDSVPAKEIAYSNTVGYFFDPTDKEKKKIISASYVYFTASEGGKWIMAANGIKFEEKMEK